MNKISVAKKLKNNINTMIGPKKRAARLLAKIPIKKLARYCRTANPTAPINAPRRTIRQGSRRSGRTR